MSASLSSSTPSPSVSSLVLKAAKLLAIAVTPDSVLLREGDRKLTETLDTLQLHCERLPPQVSTFLKKEYMRLAITYVGRVVTALIIPQFGGAI